MNISALLDRAGATIRSQKPNYYSDKAYLAITPESAHEAVPLTLQSSMSSEGDAMLQSMTEGTTSDTQTENDTPPESPDRDSGCRTPLLPSVVISTAPTRPAIPRLSSVMSKLSIVDVDEDGYETEMESGRNTGEVKGCDPGLKPNAMASPRLGALKRPGGGVRRRSSSVRLAESTRYSFSGEEDARAGLTHPLMSLNRGDSGSDDDGHHASYRSLRPIDIDLSNISPRMRKPAPSKLVLPPHTILSPETCPSPTSTSSLLAPPQVTLKPRCPFSPTDEEEDESLIKGMKDIGVVRDQEVPLIFLHDEIECFEPPPRIMLCATNPDPDLPPSPLDLGSSLLSDSKCGLFPPSENKTSAANGAKPLTVAEILFGTPKAVSSLKAEEEILGMTMSGSTYRHAGVLLNNSKRGGWKAADTGGSTGSSTDTDVRWECNA